VVTPRPEFPHGVSSDLDAILEEREEHASQLLFLPTREATCLSEELPQVKVRRANRNLTVYLLDRAYMTVHP
jgi:hypothetical protein